MPDLDQLLTLLAEPNAVSAFLFTHWIQFNEIINL